MRTQTLTLCFRRYTDCTRPSTEWGARETRVSPEDRSGKSCVPSSYKYYAAPDRRQPSSPFPMRPHEAEQPSRERQDRHLRRAESSITIELA